MRKLLAIFLVMACLLIAMPVQEVKSADGTLSADFQRLDTYNPNMQMPKTITVDGNSSTIYRGTALTWATATNTVVTRMAASTTVQPFFVGLAGGGTTSATGRVQVFYDFYFKSRSVRTITGSPELGSYIYLKTRQDKLLDNWYIANTDTALLTGTAEIAAGAGPTVTGVGSAFLSELNVGDTFYLTGESANGLVIASIADDTTMVLTGTYGGTTTTQLACYAAYVGSLTTNATETYNAVQYYNLPVGMIVEHDATNLWVVHISRDLRFDDPSLGSLTVSGSVNFIFGATDSFQIDAGTTNHTGPYIQNINLDVNSASVDAIRINADVEAALTGTEAMQGVFVDMNPLAADANGTFGIAFVTYLTHISTSRSDLYGYYALCDGTRDTDDTTVGFYIDGGTTTFNSASAILHGFEVDFAAVVDTDYATNEFTGGVIDMPAVFQGVDIATALECTGDGITTRLVTGTAGQTVYNLHAICSADNIAIFVDADTTDRTAGNLALFDVGINAAAVDVMEFQVDVGTALTADAVRAMFFDINDIAASTDTSSITGFAATITAVDTSRADLYGIDLALDGTQDNAVGTDTTYGIRIIDTTTRGTTTNQDFYGVSIDGSGYTNTDCDWVGLNIIANVAVVAGTQYAIQATTGADTVLLYLDANTTDTETASMIYADIGVNSATHSFISGLITVGTALSAGEDVTGVTIDITGLTADADTSSLTGFYGTITGAGTEQADIYGVNLLLDGVQPNADVSYGVLVTDTTTRGATLNGDFFGFAVDGDGGTLTDCDWIGYYVTNTSVVTAGTGYAGRFLMDSTAVDNAKYGLDISKDLTSNAGATTQTNNALLVTSVNANTHTSIMTVGNVLAQLTETNSTTAISADVYSGTMLEIAYSATTTVAGTATNSTTALNINYDLIETAGTLDNASFNVANIDYDTTNVNMQTGTFNLLNINGTDGALAVYAGAATFNGINIDLDTMNNTSVNLSLYGLTVTMPVTYGAAAEEAVLIGTGNTNTIKLLSGDGIYLEMIEAASIAVNMLITSAVDIDNDKQGILITKNTSMGATGTAITPSAFMGTMTSTSTNSDDTALNDLDNSISGYSMTLAHSAANTAGAGQTGEDTFSGTAIYVNVDSDIDAATADLATSARAVDILYNVDLTAAGTHTLEPLDLIRVNFDVAANITLDNAGDINMLYLDGGGFIPGTTGWSADYYVSGLKVNLVGADVNDANAYVYGARILMPATILNTTAAELLALDIEITTAVNIDNEMEGIVIAKDTSMGAGGTAISPSEFMLLLTSTSTNADDTVGNDLDNSISGASITLAHNATSAGAQTDNDTFSGTGLYMLISGDSNTAGGKLDSTPRAIDIAWSITENAGISNIEATDIVRIGCDIGAGVDIGIVGTLDFCLLKVDGDGIVPGATFGNATNIYGNYIDFSAANINDALARLYGWSVVLPSALDNTTAGVTYGGYISAVTAANIGNEHNGLLIAKDSSLDATATANIANTNYIASFTSTSTNADDLGNAIANDVNALNLTITHNNNRTVADVTGDTSSGIALNIDVTNSTQNNAFNNLTTTTRGFDLAYILEYDTAGTHNFDATDIFRINWDVEAGVTMDNAGIINAMLIDGDGFVPGATSTANMVISAFKVDLSSASANDAQNTIYGAYIQMPTASHIACADLIGLKIDGGTNGFAIDASGWVRAQYINESSYKWQTEFDEEAAAVTLTAGLRTDEWAESGLNGSADDTTYIQSACGAIASQTDGGIEDSITILWILTVFYSGSDIIMEARYQIDDRSTCFGFVGFSTTAANDKGAAALVFSNDFIGVSIDSDNISTYGATQLVLCARNNGAAVEYADLGATITNGTYITFKIDCTDETNPRCWLDATGGSIDTTDEIAIGAGVCDIAANVWMSPYIHIQQLAVDGAGRQITVDYIKCWMDR